MKSMTPLRHCLLLVLMAILCVPLCPGYAAPPLSISRPCPSSSAVSLPAREVEEPHAVEHSRSWVNAQPGKRMPSQGTADAKETGSPVGENLSALPRTGSTEGDFGRLEDAFVSMLEQWQIPGAALGIDRPDAKEYRRGFGWADVSNCVPVAPNSLFRIASLSKPITACAVLKLAASGALDLDAPMMSVLPSYLRESKDISDSRISRIAMRHLLLHTGGWDRQARNDTALRISIIRATRLLDLKDRPANAEELLRLRLTRPLDLEPGTRYAYSNFGYLLLGRVIEEASGLGYSEFVQREILVPCGIKDMHVAAAKQDGRVENEVLYYDYPGAHEVQSLWPNEGAVQWPYGGLHFQALDSAMGWIASTDSLLRFVGALFGEQGNTELLPTSSREELLCPPPASARPEEDTWHSLSGWRVRETAAGRQIWHSGTMSGTTSLVLVRPDGVRCAVLMNSRPRRWDVFNASLLDLFLSDLIRGE